MTAKQTNKKKSKLTVKQGDYEVGNKKPPKDHQFKPGQSGNPAGPPKRRTQLWVYFCRYMNMTSAQLKKLKTSELTLAQKASLKLAKNMKDGKNSGSERLALSVFDREEGRAAEHIFIGGEQALSDDECEAIREQLLGNHDTD